MSAPTRRWPARLLALGLGLGLVGMVELGLRIGGVAGGATWAPAALVEVVEDGQVSAVFQVRSEPHFVEEALPDGRPGLRTHPSHRIGKGGGFPLGGAMRDVHVSVEPAEGVRRYVVLGGSAALGLKPVGPRAARGMPTEKLPNGASVLPRSAALSGQLEQALAAAGVQAEVVDAGMIAQDSRAVWRIAEAALAMKPTGLVLYLGNNESLGMARALADVQVPEVAVVRGALRHLRIYRVLAELVLPKSAGAAPPAGAGGQATGGQAAGPGKQGEARGKQPAGPGKQPAGPGKQPAGPGKQGTARGGQHRGGQGGGGHGGGGHGGKAGHEVLARVVQGQWASAGGPLVDGVEATDDVRTAILARFRENIGGIAAMAREAGVAVYVLPTPPHLTYPPFTDAHDPGLSNDALAEASRAHAAADAALRAGDAAGALDAAERAVSADPAHGGAWFVAGIAAGQLGEHADAVDALEHALARDISHKRTDPGFAEAAAEVCAETGGCVSGDAHTALRARARAEGIGVYDEVLGDHEHLNPAGNAWVAAQVAALILADDPAP
jgi:hypothetical protein